MNISCFLKYNFTFCNYHFSIASYDSSPWLLEDVFAQHKTCDYANKSNFETSTTCSVISPFFLNFSSPTALLLTVFNDNLKLLCFIQQIITEILEFLLSTWFFLRVLKIIFQLNYNFNSSF